MLDIKTIQLFLAVQTALLGLLIILLNRPLEKRIFYYIVNISLFAIIFSLIFLNIFLGYTTELQNKSLTSLKFVPDLLLQHTQELASLKILSADIYSLVLPQPIIQPTGYLAHAKVFYNWIGPANIIMATFYTVKVVIPWLIINPVPGLVLVEGLLLPPLAVYLFT